MDIDSNCPYLLPVFGETTSHLTSKLNVMDGRTGGFLFFNVENSIKREIRKNCFSKQNSKKNIQHPPPPPEFFLHQFFLYVGNSMKREENMKYWKKKIILFFSIFKKFIKNSNNIPSISKTMQQHTPMTWCTYLQSSEKIYQCVFELVWKLNVTDRQTDGQTDRRGALQYLPSRAFGAAGDKKETQWKTMKTQSDAPWNNQGVRPGYPGNHN